MRCLGPGAGGAGAFCGWRPAAGLCILRPIREIAVVLRQ
jgi:hypothetical protein